MLLSRNVSTAYAAHVDMVKNIQPSSARIEYSDSQGHCTQAVLESPDMALSQRGGKMKIVDIVVFRSRRVWCNELWERIMKVKDTMSRAI